MKYKKRYL